jgi:hypothetical protein
MIRDPHQNPTGSATRDDACPADCVAARPEPRKPRRVRGLRTAGRPPHHASLHITKLPDCRPQILLAQGVHEQHLPRASTAPLLRRHTAQPIPSTASVALGCEVRHDPQITDSVQRFRSQSRSSRLFEYGSRSRPVGAYSRDQIVTAAHEIKADPYARL